MKNVYESLHFVTQPIAPFLHHSEPYHSESDYVVVDLFVVQVENKFKYLQIKTVSFILTQSEIVP